MTTIPQALAAAIEHHRGGRWQEAEQLYRRILEADPRHVDAWHLLGVLACQAGKHQDGVASIRRALELKPDFAEAHNNLGNALRELGRLDEAINCYRRALQFKPDYADAHNNQVVAWHRLAELAWQAGKHEEAVECLQRVLRLRPDFAAAHCNLGLLLRSQGKVDEAIACYRRALQLTPDNAEAHNNLGNALRDQGRRDEAVVCYRQALRLKPDYAEAHNNLGTALRDQGQPDEAVACYRRALQLNPDYFDAHSNLGTAFQQQGDFDEAVACYRRALRLKPDFAEAHYNLGTALKGLGKLDEAGACFDRALRSNADHADAHWNRALTWLLLGNFAQGWPEYEWRWRCKGAGPCPRFPQPLWDGSPLAGRTIYLHPEQGLGDTLQFIRYAPLVKQRGGRTIVGCHETLLSLLKSCPGIDELIPQGSALPPFDVHAPLLSLPRLLGTTPETIPGKVPYLAAPPDLAARRRQEMAHVDGLKVGICWQGNPQHTGDRWRSVRLEQLAPLAAVPGVRLFSLQKGAGAEQLDTVRQRWGITDVGRECASWAETAAAVSALDLVVTVDTAVAHLAGALGQPAWVLLPFAPDWRWLLGREDSPWYPSLRLFRQRRRGDWDEVIARLAAALAASKQAGSAVAARGRADETGRSTATADLATAIEHQRAGRLREAEQIYRQVLQADPAQADALHLLGLVASERGDDEQAIEYIRRAIRSDEHQAVFHSNLARSLHRQRRFAEAAAACRQALLLRPDDAGTLITLGAALRKEGRVAEAIAAYERALQLQPDSPEGHNNLGNVLRTEGRVAEAVLCYERALRLRPGYADAHNNLGIALKEQGRIPEAIAAYEQAVRLRPNFPEALDNLGNVLRTYGQIVAAAEHYRRAVDLRPTYVEAHSSLVYSLHFCPGIDARGLADEHRRWDRQFAEPLARRAPPHANDPAPDRRLRIGYVSPDFRDHVVGRNLLPLFRAHDRRQFEVVGYSGVARPDALTERFRGFAGAWRDVADRTDEQLDRLVRDDGIDVLVDLALHMAGGRLLVFARKPAPVQVTFAGYPGTTGLSAIDYRLTDPYLDPPGRHDDHYAEESVRFFDSFWCYEPLEPGPDVNPLPALSNGFVTFGCLNQFAKVNRPVLRLWAEVLRAVTGSRLLLLAPEGPLRPATLEQLAEDGVSPERVTFVGHQPRQQYLATYHAIDVVLDTFPYNGHTTSLEALWMGVPVITLVGQTVVGRAGLSQLTNLGLPELIADTPEDFVRIAVELAGDPPRLSGLRATLRGRMEASPLMDVEGFTRGIEAAYRVLWQRWCAGRPSAVSEP